jgi:hypothetical protein
MARPGRGQLLEEFERSERWLENIGMTTPGLEKGSAPRVTTHVRAVIEDAEQTWHRLNRTATAGPPTQFLVPVHDQDL